MEVFLPLLKDGGPWMFTLAILGWLVWWSTKQNDSARAEFLQAFKEKRLDDQTAMKQEREDCLKALQSHTDTHHDIMMQVTEQMKTISTDMKDTNRVLAQLVSRVEL